MDNASYEELYRTLSTAFDEPEDTHSPNTSKSSQPENQISIPCFVDDSDCYDEAESVFKSMNELQSSEHIECCISETENIDPNSENAAYTLHPLPPLLKNTVSDRKDNQNIDCMNTNHFENIRDPSLNVTAPPSSVLFSEITYSPQSLNALSYNNSPLPHVFPELNSPINSIITNPISRPGSCVNFNKTPMPSDSSDTETDYFRNKVLKRKFSIKNFIKRKEKTLGHLKHKRLRLDSSSLESLNETALSDESTHVHEKKSRKGVKKTNPGKKRSKNDKAWIDNVRKVRCNLGEAYASRDGTLRQAKVMKSPCKCNLKCYEKCPELLRKKIFAKYWSLGEHVMQWNFIAKYVKKIDKQRHTTSPSTSSRRSFTYQYTMPVGSSVIKVCQVMFLNTLGISKKMVYTSLEKDQSESKIVDNRGRHGKHKTVITDAMIENVIRHVNSFKPVDSHLIRKDSSRKYLDPDLSFTKMFQLYREWCVEKQITKRDTAKSVRQYRGITNTHMNIGSFIPKKDQCDICHTYKNQRKPSEKETSDYENHLKEKRIARDLKASEKTESRNNSHVLAVTFDFQKVLSCPFGEISIFYYKRKLAVYNFTLFEMGSKTGKCYMWHEATAKRGSNEVASCLYEYINEQVQNNDVTDFRFWSDNCTGQNRNRIVFFMYLHVAKKLKIKISHKFMEVGHTQNEGDSVHANIERSAKRKLIYTPNEWYTLVRWSKTNEPSYEVYELQQNEVYDFKAHLDTKEWSKNTENEKISWTDIKEIFVDYTSDGHDHTEDIIYYKNRLSQERYKILNCGIQNCTRVTRNTQSASITCEEVLVPAYNKPLPLPALKVRDLQYLCNKGLIPQRHHNFFNSFEKKTDNSSDSAED